MKKETQTKLMSWFYQTIIFIAIFVAITVWQQRNMLDVSSEEMAPNLSLATVKNETFKFNPAAQEKPTLIYFFAPWCSICHASIDNIESIKKGANDKYNFVTVALDWQSKEEVLQFLAKHNLTMPVLLGTQETQEQFKIGGFPSYYVIDKNGRFQSKDMGYTTEIGMRIRLGLAAD